MIAAVETGGTKVFCAVAERDAPDKLVDTIRIPTTDPDQTLGAINAFLTRHHERAGIEAVGVASFGPLDTSPDSPKYGWVTTTPKPGWANTDLHRVLEGLGDVPVGFVSDVTGSLLGERRFGAARGLDDAAYVTVGTGVGIGIISGGTVISEHGSPELGHFLVRRHPDDHYEGFCPFHGDCLEGLAAGQAVKQRWGRAAQGSEVGIIASYIAQLMMVLALAVAPQRIILGGGVPKTPGLLDEVRSTARDLVNGYLGADHPIMDVASGFIVPPGLGDMAGVHGALVLAGSLLDGDKPGL